MPKKIYNVDPSQKITPLMVRDAIVECFYHAHCADSEISVSAEENDNRNYCQSIARKAFEDSDDDFDRPTKKSIVSAINNLAEFAKNFRDPEIIKKHYNEIMVLINKL